METNPEEFVRKLREAKENGADLILVCTNNDHFLIKDLSKLDMSNPKIRMQGNNSIVWFKDITPGITHAFVPGLIKEIRTIGKQII